RGCLAGLGAGAYLALTALGAERVVARADACADCAWHGLQGRVEAQTQQAQQMLAAWERGTLVAARTEPVEPGIERVVWDTQNPPLSRRDLFQRLSHLGQVAAARAWTAGEASSAARAPGRDRRRTVQASKSFAAGQAQPLPAAAPAMGSDWAVVSISEACSACGACARTCPTNALRLEHTPDSRFALHFSPLACMGCEACQHVCAPAAISVNHAPTFEQIFSGEDQTLLAGELVLCERCHTPMAARAGARWCSVCAARVRSPFGQHLPPGLRGAQKHTDQVS
ncbi:MAG: 4Fe-4S dicluster domain-containing protein, partial [Arenimonas sp.]